MIALAQMFRIFKNAEPRRLHAHGEHLVIAFERAGLIFAFNFHPTVSHFGYRIEAPPGKYRTLLDSDAPQCGGYSRLMPGEEHVTLDEEANGYTRTVLSLYLPTRTAVVLEKLS
jgi:1,4-alpha-glucan branching enzyme